MSQDVRPMIMLRNALESAGMRADLHREWAGLPERRNPDDYVVMVGRKS